MKIAGLADGRARKDLEARAADTGVQIAWVDSADALSEHPEAIAYFDLSFEMNTARIEQLRRLLPKPVVINSVIHTLKQVGQPFIRINAWPGFLEREICEIAFWDNANERENANGSEEEDAKKRKDDEDTDRREDEKKIAAVLKRLNWPYRVVPDIPGMISARVVAAIVNEAYYTLQDEVSTKASIDTAMKLGTNYPHGPFEWASLTGLQNIHSLLASLEITDPCYKISDLLKAEAQQEFNKPDREGRIRL